MSLEDIEARPRGLGMTKTVALISRLVAMIPTCSLAREHRGWSCLGNEHHQMEPRRIVDASMHTSICSAVTSIGPAPTQPPSELTHSLCTPRNSLTHRTLCSFDAVTVRRSKFRLPSLRPRHMCVGMAHTGLYCTVQDTACVALNRRCTRVEQPRRCSRK
ncbi:hypothetical protein BDW22DRAFT_412074 [Trametopsis cervina]|nr:hypothetical protein BDW22DRAFT_412074 [Trametopsis cervina]